LNENCSVPIDEVGVTGVEVTWRYVIAPLLVEKVVPDMSTPSSERFSVQVDPVLIEYGTYQKLATYGRDMSRPTKFWDTVALGDVE
jgi:hypothetical protein